jgi:hypothetical protein
VRAGQPLRAEEGLKGRDVIEAALTIVEVQAGYARRGLGMAEAALAGARRTEPLRHYPAADVVDRDGRGQFYYHAHDSSRRPDDEHGHFHLFLRRPGGGFFHLAGLSLDAHGWPLRWFTTNRWVTGGDWVDADTAIAALPCFAPRTHGRLAPVARWLGAMVTLYADTLAGLLRRRDAVVVRRLAHQPAERLFEDRRLDVITEVRVALPRRLGRLTGLPGLASLWRKV